jgi:glutamate synthase domain-containing protein 1
VIIAHQGEMIGLTDRIRLRPLTVGVKDSVLYLSSEESAIRLVCPDLDRAWIPMGGEPIIGSLEKPLGHTVVQKAAGDAVVSHKACVNASK